METGRAPARPSVKMAVLRNPRTGTRILLRTLHLFGRHPSCQTIMDCPDVSIMHALVRWNVGHWQILDSSRNGTLLDGKRLTAGDWTALDGARALSMGECDSAQWHVEDLAEPIDCVFPLAGTDRAIALLPGGTFVPPGLKPRWMICLREGEWIAESDDGRTNPIADGASLTLEEREWQVVLHQGLAPTRESDGSMTTDSVLPSSLVLHFSLSQNEEHTVLTVESDAGYVDLGERVYHYALATLARVRQRHAQHGVNAKEQGWVRNDELTRMLAVDMSYVNIQLFRARQQMAKALQVDAADLILVERRRGEIRLGDFPFTLRRGAVIEGGMARAPSGELVPT